MNILQQWNRFKEMVLPASECEDLTVQEAAMMGFFAGAHTAFHNIVQIAQSGDAQACIDGVDKLGRDIAEGCACVNAILGGAEQARQ